MFGTAVHGPKPRPIREDGVELYRRVDRPEYGLGNFDTRQNALGLGDDTRAALQVGRDKRLGSDVAGDTVFMQRPPHDISDLGLGEVHRGGAFGRL